MKNVESIDLEALADELSNLSMKALRERFALHYNYTSQSRKKDHLISKILWAAQRDALGDISEQSRTNALQIADDRDVRERFPKPKNSSQTATDAQVTVKYTPPVELAPGTQLFRDYKGEKIEVLIMENGFRYKNRWYKSLSAIAREVTGTQWNGRLFFKVKGAA